MKRVQNPIRQPEISEPVEEHPDSDYWLDKTSEECLRAMLEINKRVNDQKYGPDRPFQKVIRIVKLKDKNLPHQT